jgi:putative oxygen-independent coproporphyrinogen III oxidase
MTRIDLVQLPPVAEAFPVLAGGLYVHVPFCPKVCPYCDFAVMKAPERLHSVWLELVQKEWVQSCEDYPAKWQTMYMGGGTPSLLNESVFRDWMSFIDGEIGLKSLLEVTMECNPETLSPSRLELWQESGVDRFSFGIQSFAAERLKWLGRNHGPETLALAQKLLSSRQAALSVDIMFGFVGQTWEDLRLDLSKALEFEPEHLSLYGLTIEPGTLFGQMSARGEVLDSEEAYDELYLRAVEYLAEQGVMRYELSNFARPGFEAKHNSGYWNHRPYLGIGPGAHSYLNGKRSWNPKSWPEWERRVRGLVPREFEELTEANLYNEKIWMGLRQSKGVSLSDLRAESLQKARQLCLQGLLREVEGYWILTDQGWPRMDEIASGLMI